MKKSICTLAAIGLVCLTPPNTSHAQDAEPPTGLEGLAQLAAVLQALIDALNALAMWGQPTMSPGGNGGMMMPVQNPMDPNMFMPPTDPNTIILPIGCDISFFPNFDLGESFFLPEFESIAGFPNRIGYAEARDLDAFTIEDQICNNPGIGVRILNDPVAPLQFTGTAGGPFPSPATRASPIVYTASDTRQRGVCRPGEIFQGAGLGMDCIAVGRVQYIFDERVRMDSPSTWGTVDALRETSQVTLLIFTPSELLRGTGIFF